MKKLLHILLVLFLVVVLAAGGLIGWLTAVEYRPLTVEKAEIVGSSDRSGVPAEGLRVLSWNIGYAGLGAEEDFFMDGGKNARPSDNATVNRYLNGIKDSLDELGADVILLQEVDKDSSRSYRIDESVPLQRANSVFALNYSCPFVPVPFPPMGRVVSGLLTTADYPIEHAERVSLTCPFAWPLRVANLKRCLLVSYLPIEGSDRQLVLVNLHLEAYDEGEGKIAQTKELNAFIQGEYEKGNYVIAGGDFNQTFPGGLDAYPILDPSLWTPGVLFNDMLPEGWSFAYDTATPSCRLLDRPYDPATAQHYIIDGYILSPNVELVSVNTADLGFTNSDHNPVELVVNLK